MAIWGIILGFAVLASFWMARPFLRQGRVELNDTDSVITIFRDQMDEVERDLQGGMISVAECDAARREIEARTLHAARNMDGGVSVSRRSLPMVAGIVAGALVLSVAGYAMVGVPNQPDHPLASRKTEILLQRAASGDMNSRIALLIDRTAQNPASFEDWWTLGVSYASIGDHASSVDAYRKAAELGGDRPGVLSAYAEAMTLANGNKVPQAARVIFEQILQSGPDARARYYVALSKAQAQDFDAALEDWAALARDSQPNAPWMALVRRDIVNMARFLKVEVTDYLPDTTPSEIAKAGGAMLPADTTARSKDLELRLQADPLDYQGWIELAEVRSGQGNDAGAAEALETARRHYAAAPFVLQKIDEATRALGLDLLRGPTQDDIAAAAELTEAERSDMIDGMVAGLAAKLDENPYNPDGWIMLVRSYRTLGQADKAEQAYQAALAALAGNTALLSRIKQGVERIGN